MAGKYDPDRVARFMQQNPQIAQQWQQFQQASNTRTEGSDLGDYAVIVPQRAVARTIAALSGQAVALGRRDVRSRRQQNR